MSIREERFKFDGEDITNTIKVNNGCDVLGMEKEYLSSICSIMIGFFVQKISKSGTQISRRR